MVMDRYTMSRGVYIPWVGGRYIMAGSSIYHGKGLDIPLVGSIHHE